MTTLICDQCSVPGWSVSWITWERTLKNVFLRSSKCYTLRLFVHCIPSVFACVHTYSSVYIHITGESGKCQWEHGLHAEQLAWFMGEITGITVGTVTGSLREGVRREESFVVVMAPWYWGGREHVRVCARVCHNVTPSPVWVRHPWILIYMRHRIKDWFLLLHVVFTVTITSFI